MSTAPSSQREPRTDARRGPSLVAYVGLAVGLLSIFVVLCAVGAVDERVAPLWNPGVLFATAAGLAYVEPRPPVWRVTFAGAVLGLAYGGLVLVAEALSAPQTQLDPAELLARAVGIGAVPALVGGLFLRWFAPAAPGARAG